MPWAATGRTFLSMVEKVEIVLDTGIVIRYLRGNRQPGA